MLNRQNILIAALSLITGMMVGAVLFGVGGPVASLLTAAWLGTAAALMRWLR